MNYFGSIFAMVVCIAMSAYFSATETAFSSLNKTRLKVLADNGNKRAALALKLSEDYDKLISTILIGNNIVNIMVASIGTLLFVGLYGDMGATVSTVVVTISTFGFGTNTTRWKKILKSWTRIPTTWTAPSAWRILGNSLTSRWNRTVFLIGGAIAFLINVVLRPLECCWNRGCGAYSQHWSFPCFIPYQSS